MGIPLIFSDEKQGYVNDKRLYHFNFFSIDKTSGWVGVNLIPRLSMPKTFLLLFGEFWRYVGWLILNDYRKW